MRLCICGSVRRVSRAQMKNVGNSTIERICRNRMLLTMGPPGVPKASFWRTKVTVSSMISTSGPTTSDARPNLRCKSMRPVSDNVACTASNVTHDAITAACRCTASGGLGIVPWMIASERGTKPATAITTNNKAMPVWNSGSDVRSP